MHIFASDQNLFLDHGRMRREPGDAMKEIKTVIMTVLILQLAASIASVRSLLALYLQDGQCQQKDQSSK
jgi:hypothetical protein